MKIRVLPLSHAPDELSVIVPGDKSIAHRAMILASLAQGTSVIENVPANLDCRATSDVLTALGSTLARDAQGTTIVLGMGGELTPPRKVLDCANSGTTARLMAGVLASQPFRSVLDGDISLRGRPMRRVAKPLREMGANIRTSGRMGTLPMTIQGHSLTAAQTIPTPASAQVKGAILLAALRAKGTTTVMERTVTRDHMERLLPMFGVQIATSGSQCSLRGGQSLRPAYLRVPGDFSSAAFWLGLAAAVPSLRLIVRGVSLNPTRLGFVDLLMRMGARIREEVIVWQCDEWSGHLDIRGARLQGIDVPPSCVPLIIDEIPILAVIASMAVGVTTVRGAEDLRRKECDRIRAICVNLRAMGVDIEEFPDGFTIRGRGRLRGAEVHSYGDHRIAMAFAIAGLLAEEETIIHGADCLSISYPGFLEDVLPDNFQRIEMEDSFFSSV